MGKTKRKCLSMLLAGCLSFCVFLPSAAGTEVKAAANLTDGLIGYWTFDGTSETEQMVNKASGQSCTAAKAGSGVTLKSGDGVFGGSIYFSKMENSYLKLNLKDAGQGLNAANQDFSIAAWVKFDSNPFQAGTDKINLFQQTADISDTNAAGRTIVYLNSSKQYGTFLTGSDALCNQQGTPGSWQHLVFTCNHSTKKAQFYINGMLASEHTLTGEFADAATDILVGAHKNPQAAGAVKGSLDELRYYNKVVDAETVKAMYDAFGDVIAIENLSAELRELIAEAEGLNGGDEDTKELLLAKIAAAEELLESSALTTAALEEQIASLESAVDAYKKTAVISIAVDPDTKVREISDAMFGINHRYHNDGYSSWDAVNQRMEPEFDRLAKEASFGSVRYPGGTVANLYDWKKAIGPFADRKKTIHGNTREPITPNFGVNEAMKWIYDELDAEAVWVYAMGQGSAEDAADLFEYLNAPADGDLTNPNGGTDWAEVRKENGHPEPYGVTRFEIGNEMGLWGQNYWMPGCGSANYANMASAYVNGGDMTFTKERAVQEEDWRDSAAVSDGSAGQVRYARYKFVKENSTHVYVNDTEWQIVDSLDGQGAANVCEFEYETGKITFGNGTNGNIPPQGNVITVTYTSKQDGFTAYYAALKKIAEELGMEVEVYSCMEREAAIRALQDAGNQYDGAVIHPYSETSANYDYPISESDPLFYEKVLGRSLEHNMSRVQELKELMGDGKVPVVSEFGIYRHNSQFIRAIGHAVYIANEIIDYVNFGTPYLNKHCLVDYPFGDDNLGTGAQCVIQAHVNDDGTKDFVSTPSAKAFSIFNNMTGSEQIGQTVTGNGVYYTFERNGSYEVPVLKAISSKDDEGNIYVTAVNNRKNDTTPVTISVDGRNLQGEEIEIWYLTSDNVEDENTVAAPNHVDVVKTKADSSQESFFYELAPHSITAFKIPAEKTVSVSVRAEAGGTAEGSTEIKAGSEVTVTAVPDKGYVFDGWYADGVKVSNQAVYTFTASENAELIAKFIKETSKDDQTPENKQPPAAGDKITDPVTNGTYTVTSSASAGITAAYTGMANENLTSCTVPDTIKINGVNCKVTSVAAEAFADNKKLISVTMGDQIEKIGENAFSGCSNLKTVTIGKNVTEIEKKAFFKNTSLKKITIPANIRKIGASAFQGSKKLKTITIKSKKLTKKTVGKNAFKQINPKAKIKVPSNKLKAYKKLLKSKGLPAKASVKK